MQFQHEQRDIDAKLLKLAKEKNSDINQVDQLIKQGANINAQDSDQCTALIWASYNKREDIVDLLLEKGANLELESKYGTNALLFAAEVGCDAIVKKLVKAGAFIDFQTSRLQGYCGLTALYFAARDKHVTTVELLLSLGASFPLSLLGDLKPPALLREFLIKGIQNKTPEIMRLANDKDKIIRIKDNFYFERLANTPVYSDIPSDQIDFLRLLNGQKPFHNISASRIKDKKILIICGFDLFAWNVNQRMAYRLRIENLIKEGFQLFHYIKSNLQPFDLTCLNSNYQFWDNLAVPDQQHLVRLLDVPIGEMFIFDASFSRRFMEGDAGDWEYLESFHEVCLNKSPINMKSLSQLLLKYGETITKLDLSNCINLTGEFSADLKLPKLKELVIDFTLMNKSQINCLLNSNQLNHLLHRSPLLTSLELKAITVSSNLLQHVQNPEGMTTLVMPNASSNNNIDTLLLTMNTLTRLHIPFDTKLLSQLNLNHITELGLTSEDINNLNIDLLTRSFTTAPNLRTIHLNLAQSSLSLEGLSQLWMYASKLTTLDLRNCRNIHDELKEIPNFSSLEALDLFNTPITMQSLGKLLTHASNLKKLNLSYCQNINDELSDTPNLSSLKSLDLSNSPVTMQSLGKLLTHASNLKKLDLRGCSNIHDELKETPNLSSLESLEFSCTHITMQSLGKLLTHASNLKKLDLRGCSNIHDELKETPNLSSLESLDLFNTPITMQSLRKLLTHASNLKQLNLYLCTNINDELSTTLNLPSLELLELSYTSLTMQSLWKLLTHASNLKILNSRGCSNIHDELKETPNLPILESLEFSYTHITMQSLGKLLTHASNLKKLNLSYCQNINDELPDTPNLSSLESLELSNTPITMQSLGKLLTHASNLKYLNLTCCYNIPSALLKLFIGLSGVTIKKQIEDGLIKQSKKTLTKRFFKRR